MTRTELSATTLVFKRISDQKPDTVAILSLHRPQSANAFNGEMVQELTTHLNVIAENEHCRLVILRGTGKNFCAGADLNWMKDFANLSLSDNIIEARIMTEMYEALYRLPKPTIAVVQGAVYGGAVGLVAACDTAIAVDDARFCLSEVRVGLIPAVILPYVARKLQPGQVRRHMMSGRVFKATEALQFGLVEQLCKASDLEQVVLEEINTWLAGSPDAQKKVKELYLALSDTSLAQTGKTAEAIAAIRSSPVGQNGIKAFFNKQKPAWVCEAAKGWTIDG